MKSLFVVLLLSVTGKCFCQFRADPQAIQFLNDFVNTREKKENLYFKANMYPEMTDHLIKNLDWKTDDSAYWDRYNRKTPFEFSSQEKEQITKIWLSQKNTPWDSATLEHATIFYNPPLLPENFTREQNREYLKHFEGKHIIQFSVPVFIRNKSICVFFYITYGGGTLYILKKEDGKWIPFLERALIYS